MDANRLRRALPSALAVVAVMAVSLLLRAPAASLPSYAGETRADLTDATGLPYLTEMDSYYGARLTENYLDHGSLGDSASASGEPWDLTSYAPTGRSARYTPGIVLCGAAVYHVASMFANVSPLDAIFWTGAIVSCLAAIPAFLLGRRMSNRLGGICAALLVCCSVYYVSHTYAGFYDTDMFVALFPVTMMLLFTEAVRARDIRGRVCCALGFAATTALFSFCWGVYTYFIAIPFVAGILFLALLGISRLVRRTGGDRGHSELLAVVLCIGLAIVVMTVVVGPSFLVGLTSLVSSASSITDAGVGFPNVFISISELQAPTLVVGGIAGSFLAFAPGSTEIGVVNGMGGTLVVASAALGLVLLALRSLSAFRTHAAAPVPARRGLVATSDGAPMRSRWSALYLALLFTWIALCAYGTMKGVRFIEHLAFPVGILAGACVGWIVDCLRVHMRNRAVLLAAGAVTAAALVGPTLLGAWTISNQATPSASDSYADAMGWVSENTGDDAIVASWWDNGYFYEYASGRGTLFDGGSPSGIRAVFMGKVLLSSDDRLTRGILRMFASSGDAAVTRMVELTGLNARAAEALVAILPVGREQALSILTGTYGLDQEDAAQIVSLTHPATTRPVYLVLSSDMANKAYWWSAFATWDFSGVASCPLTYENARQTLPTTLNQTISVTGTVETSGLYEQSLFYRLFYKGGANSTGFSKAYEMTDSLARVQVWRVDLGTEN